MAVTGLGLFATYFVISIFVGNFDKWSLTLMEISGIGLFLGSELIKRWSSNLSWVSKMLSILVAILLAVAFILALINRPDAAVFSTDVERIVLFVAFILYIIYFFKIQYESD